MADTTLREDNVTFKPTDGSPVLVLDKAAAGTAAINFKAAGVLRGQLVLDASENLILKVYDTDGTTLQGSFTVAQAGGAVTFTDGITVSDGTVTISETAALALSVAGLPAASTTIPLVRLGDAALVGGSANGTFLGMNTDAAAVADLVNLQNNDASMFSVDASGRVIAAGGLTVSAGSVTVTGTSIVGLHEHVTLQITNLVGTDAKVYGFASPVAGTITKIQSCLNGAALTTGDATITGKIASTAITNGALTITQSGSAAGDIDTANPTAANTVSVGSYVNFTVSGTNDATAAFATVTVTFLRSA